MALHYHPKHFLRQIPRDLLQDFFHVRGVLNGFDWSETDDGVVDRIFEALQLLPELKRAEIERAFRLVAELASPEGLQSLIDESHFHRVDLLPSLEPISGLHQKVFWILLKHQNIFGAASRLYQADRLNSRYWRRRTDLPAMKPDITHPTRELLAQAISKYFREEQGRGEHCKVEVYLRREKIHYFFAYPANYADTVIVYNDAGVLARQTQKAAFEVIFAYHEDTGVLDLFVQGDKKVRREMEAIFARLVLKVELPAENPGRQPFDLSGLRAREFDFPTEPADGIKEVRVKSLRLSIIGPGFGRISFESDARTKRGDLYDLMDKSLNHAHLNGETVSVSQAMMQVTFAEAGKSKPVTFQISCPDSCNLKDKPEHLKIKEYLKRWGIARE